MARPEDRHSYRDRRSSSARERRDNPIEQRHTPSDDAGRASAFGRTSKGYRQLDLSPSRYGAGSDGSADRRGSASHAHTGGADAMRRASVARDRYSSRDEGYERPASRASSRRSDGSRGSRPARSSWPSQNGSYARSGLGRSRDAFEAEGRYRPGEDFDPSYADDTYYDWGPYGADEGAAHSRTRSSASRAASGRAGMRTQRSSAPVHGRASAGTSRGSSVTASVADTIGDVASRYRVPIVAVLAIVLIVTAMAFTFNNGIERIHQGVSIGSIDVSGKTAEEARALVVAGYADKLASTDVVIYADEDAANSLDVSDEVRQQEALAEQISWEEDRQNRRFWIADAESLGSELDLDGMVAEAMSYGRDDEDPAKQVSSAGFSVPVMATFDDGKVESLAEAIDVVVGDRRIDNDIAIQDSTAVLVDGHDGRMVDRDLLKDRIQTRFFELTESGPFIAEADDAPSRTTPEQAAAVKDLVNAALAREVTFTYKDKSYTIPREHIAAGIITKVVETDDGWDLKALFDTERMQANLIADIDSETGGDYHIEFVKSGDDVTVKIDGEVEVPKISDAAVQLQDNLLDNPSEEGGAVSVTVESEIAPPEMPLEQAIDWGIVDRISRFTTQFVNSTATENRSHNIKLAASILNDSIVKPGGTWSFNDVAGEASAERGYKGAGAIVNDEYTDEVGGGICQVATTVFNAVYAAGFPISERHNHTLYIASYPAGRDAAIAYPFMDLKWSNDTDSDVLLMCTTTDDSITVTLYGSDPGYQVSSEAGEWEEGEEFEEVVEVDETLAPGTSYVKTAGADGRRITVYRTVTDADGNVIRTDSFISIYSPVDEVVVRGPKLPTIDQIPTVPERTVQSDQSNQTDQTNENQSA